MSTTLSIRPAGNGDFFRLSFSNDLFEEMQNIQGEIAREAFGLFEQRRGDRGDALDDWLRAESALLEPVPVSISDEKGHLKVTAEVPGFAMNELKMHIEGQELQIYGSSEKKAEKGDKKSGKLETYGSSRKIWRNVGLPVAVKAGAASAVLDKGILTLTLPKAEPAKEIAAKAA